MNKLQSIKDITDCIKDILVNNLKLKLEFLEYHEEKKSKCFGFEKGIENGFHGIYFFVVGSNKNLKIENEFNKLI